MVRGAAHLAARLGADGHDGGVLLGALGGEDSLPSPAGRDEIAGAHVSDRYVASCGPYGDLSGHAPGAVVLGASEPVGLFGGEQLHPAAVGEDELTQRPVPGVDPVLGEHSEDPALAFDAGVAGVRVGGGHYCPPRAGVCEGLLLDPFGAGAGLAPPAAGEDEPHEPVVGGWALVGAGVPWDPVVRCAGAGRPVAGPHVAAQIREALQLREAVMPVQRPSPRRSGCRRWRRARPRAGRSRRPPRRR